jgi:phosphoglycerol transferase MdoB-like AlkP superfamily enzyme
MVSDTNNSSGFSLKGLLTFQNGRINLLVYIFAIQLLVFFGLRTVLLVQSFSEIDHDISTFFRIYSIGAIYDFTFLLYFNISIALFLFCFSQNFYQKKFLFIGFFILLAILLSIFLFSTVAEWFFWDEFGVRLNFIAVSYLIYVTEVINNIKQSYPLKTILTLLFLTSSIILFFPRKKIYQCFIVKDTASFRLKILGLYFAILILLGVFVNQNLRESNASNHTKELCSNGQYQFFFSYRYNKIPYRRFYKLGEDVTLSSKLLDLISKGELISYKNNFNTNEDKQASDKLLQVIGKNPDATASELFGIGRDVAPKEEEKKYNVILISVESLSAKFMKRFGSTENITPYLDKLLESSLLFNNFYATGTRTVRGLESISLAIPPTPGQAIVRREDNKGFHSMGHVFREHGYESVFFYGGNGFFDNMNDFFSGNSYSIIDKKNLASNEISFENAWGVADEDLFDRSLKEADKNFEKNQKFFYHIMTVSNHKPYSYPDNKIDIPSFKGRDGAVKYTDYAIGKFMERAQSKPWYPNTVFIIVADHCASIAGKIGLDVKSYHIPFMIHCPSLIKAGENSKVASQIDIAPTLFSLLNFKYKNYFLGDDILSDKFTERAFISNYDKMGYLKNNILCVLSLRKIVDFYSFDGKEITPLTTPDKNILDETMAYYQGIDYILEHRLFRTNPAPK